MSINIYVYWGPRRKAHLVNLSSASPKARKCGGLEPKPYSICLVHREDAGTMNGL